MGIDNDNKYQCNATNHCNKRFSSKISLQNHIANQHRSYLERKYVCNWNECGKRFATQSAYKQHTTLHESCLKRHILKHTGNLPKYNCRDPNCTQTFTRKQKLNEHMRIHSGERPFI